MDAIDQEQEAHKKSVRKLEANIAKLTDKVANTSKPEVEDTRHLDEERVRPLAHPRPRSREVAHRCDAK